MELEMVPTYRVHLQSTGAPSNNAQVRMVQESCRHAIADVAAVREWLD